MANIKNVALLDEQNRLINHVVVDIEDEVTLNALYEQWNAVRYVETHDEHDIIIHDSPEIWSIWSDETQKFTIVGTESSPQISQELDREIDTVVIDGNIYPVDSLVFEENAANRPAGWSGEEYKLSDYL